VCLAKKSLCEVRKIGDNTVFCVRPIACKFKAIACFSPIASAVHRLFDVAVAGGVAAIFCVRTVADEKNLHIFKQTRSCPKAIVLIAIYLVECFANIGTAPF
jgi:hypothetical protein